MPFNREFPQPIQPISGGEEVEGKDTVNERELLGALGLSPLGAAGPDVSAEEFQKAADEILPAAKTEAGKKLIEEHRQGRINFTELLQRLRQLPAAESSS